jgi:hypothetical protein
MSAMIDAQPQGGHGGQVSKESNFSRLLKKHTDYKPLKLSDPDTVIGIVARFTSLAREAGIARSDDPPLRRMLLLVPAGILLSTPKDSAARRSI